jgi:molybdopterin converting factor small subunit
VSEIIAAAEEQFGTAFSRILSTSNVWLNGEPVQLDAPVNGRDEVAVIPPVSGG